MDAPISVMNIQLWAATQNVYNRRIPPKIAMPMRFGIFHRNIDPKRLARKAKLIAANGLLAMTAHRY